MDFIAQVSQAGTPKAVIDALLGAAHSNGVSHVSYRLFSKETRDMGLSTTPAGWLDHYNTSNYRRFDPGPTGPSPETYFSMSIGGGVHVLARKRVGIRLEGRFVTTLVDSDSKLFCRTGPDINFCSIQIEGKAFTQFELRAGVAFRFGR